MNLGVCHVGAFSKGEAKDFTAVGDVANTAHASRAVPASMRLSCRGLFMLLSLNRRLMRNPQR